MVTPVGKHPELVPGIPGPMQDQNLALAVAALDAARLVKTEEALRLGAKRAFAPGRFQRIRFRDREFLFDGAHNPDAARVLRRWIEESLGPRRIILLTNMVMGHEPSQFYREIAPIAASAHVVPIDFHRAVPVSVVAEGLRALVPSVQAHDSVEGGIEAAVGEAGPDDIILVTGSFYLVGEVGRAMTALCT